MRQRDDMTFPADWRATELAGKSAKVQLKVHKVSEPHLPEIDELAIAAHPLVILELAGRAAVVVAPHRAQVRDLPPVESLNKDSDFTPFFATNVPDFLKRHAFKVLWASSPFFNFRDGLDDYDENFRLIDKLITAADSDYKAGKGYGLEDEPDEDDDDIGDGEDDAIAEDGNKDADEEQVAAADEEKPDEDSEEKAEPEAVKEPRKSDVRPPDDAV